MGSGQGVVLAVHGGAGPLAEPEKSDAYAEAVTAALRAGFERLGGGSSVDAVEAAVRVLEDSALFNAGRGSALHRDGGCELDASIMRGDDRAAGAVAAVTRLRNPIHAARLVMEGGRHVLMAGGGAEEFTVAHGAETAPPEYFVTGRRRAQLAAAREHGTVGAVSRDRRGDLAAGTSTGGFTNKLPGRVGDSPIVGAGTYADNRTVAVSCTGAGEVFLRGVVAYGVAARIAYGGQPLGEAADAALAEVSALGGTGGLIALDLEGRFAAPHTTPAMVHGAITAAGDVTVVFSAEGGRGATATP